MISAKVVTTDTRGVYDSILREISKLDGQAVKAGILAKDATLPYERGLFLGQVAAINEFGLGTTPERSFERSTFDERNRHWFNGIRRNMASTSLHSAFSTSVLLRAGKVMQKDIRTKIVRMRNPANAARTIRRKGFNNPLVENGRLHRNIRYALHRSRL